MDIHGLHVIDTITTQDSPDIGTSGEPFGDIYGKSSGSQWGDLAEKYRCNPEQCEAGLVVSVTNQAHIDVEPCNEDLSTSVVGVVSTKPGFKMNEQLPEGKFIALTGLVPVKIKGPIYKGDFIVPTVDGSARCGKPHEIGYKMGVAQETNIDLGFHSVNCIIK